MAPKAKVKAKAMAVVRRGVRRPAIRVAPLRRPAALAGVPGGGDLTPWRNGEEVILREVASQDLEVGQLVCLPSAKYFQSEVKVAGYLEKIEVTREDMHIYLALTGTSSEDLLRLHGQHPNQLLQVHCCARDCGLHESGDWYVHASKGKLLITGGVREDWTSNLEQVGRPRGVEEIDELSELRRRALEREKEIAGAQPVEELKDKGPGGSSGSQGSKRKKSKKEKKKKRKEKGKEKEMISGRYPVTASQKEVHSLFGGTGLDPKEKVRKKVLKQAKKFLMKKGKTESSSSSSSSESSTSSQEELQPEGLFVESSRSRAVAERYPGVLAFEAAKLMQSTLLTEQGEDGGVASGRPTVLLYYRQHLQQQAHGAMLREMLNLATALDMVLRGRPAQAADVLAQRLKSLEAMTHGTHWSVAQKLEVPLPDQATIAQRNELHVAHKESYQDAKVRYQTSYPGKGGAKGSKGGDYKGGKGEREVKGGKKAEDREKEKGKKGGEGKK